MIDERRRHDLFLRLEQVLGTEEASTLMEHLPPVGWSDLATKADLDGLRTATKADLDELRTATKRDLDVSVELLRFELRTDIAQLETRILDRMRTQTWTLFTALVVGMGLAATLARV